MTAPLPQLWGTLYAAPNSNGERKACSNCRFASSGGAGMLVGGPVSKCEILPTPITPEMVCGYHVPAGELADPELAGLETVPGGTSCDTCTYYQPLSLDKGLCVGTEGEDGEPAHVDGMGCCARWEGAEAGVEPEIGEEY